MTDDHADVPAGQGTGEIVGGQLLDAADPAHGIQPDACLVCRTTDARQLHRVSLYPPDLAAAGLPAGRPPVVCLAHYEAALRSLGQPTPAGNHNSCIACHHGDTGYFATVAVWPLRLTSAAQPTYRACVRHLAGAIASLTQEASA